MARASIAFAVVMSAVLPAIMSIGMSIGASISTSGVAGAPELGGRSASLDSDFAAIRSCASDAVSGTSIVSSGCVSSGFIATGVVAGAPSSIKRAAAGRATDEDVLNAAGIAWPSDEIA